MYRLELASFFGVEGTYYGIEDELYGLKKLIEVIGNTVINEEKEFIEIQKKQQEREGEYYSSPTQNELAAWHKKAFRQFTYKAIMSLIQSTFESGLQNLHDLLVNENQIEEHRKDKTKLKDTLTSLSQLDTSFLTFWDEIRPYAFIRNKLGHRDGIFYEDDANVDAYNAFVRTRSDVTAKDEGKQNGKRKYRLKIHNSTILSDYLKLVTTIFSKLSMVCYNRAAITKK